MSGRDGSGVRRGKGSCRLVCVSLSFLGPVTSPLVPFSSRPFLSVPRPRPEGDERSRRADGKWNEWGTVRDEERKGTVNHGPPLLLRPFGSLLSGRVSFGSTPLPSLGGAGMERDDMRR